MATKFVRVPYTLALVIVGLVISPMHFLPVAHVSPELILLIFLPALLFEAAWNLKLDHLRENWLPIMTLAIIGVAVSVGLIGAILHWGIGLAWPSAMLFGAMISATDPGSCLGARPLQKTRRAETVDHHHRRRKPLQRWNCRRRLSHLVGEGAFFRSSGEFAYSVHRER
jgi:CPA1 family monovalent cation:H+ antiporter